MLVGVNTKLPDEIVGLATWACHDAYAASMPAISPYPVEFYEPIAEA